MTICRVVSAIMLVLMLSNEFLPEFVSVKAKGAKGDGVHDDTDAIQSVLDDYAGCKIIYFDAGTYYVTDTIKIPEGTIVVGEIWSTIIGGGRKFADQKKPRPVVEVGCG
jgi:glucan 1,3-beta-glucosidase